MTRKQGARDHGVLSTGQVNASILLHPCQWEPDSNYNGFYTQCLTALK